jgi:hypothetical protein
LDLDKVSTFVRNAFIKLGPDDEEDDDDNDDGNDDGNDDENTFCSNHLVVSTEQSQTRVEMLFESSSMIISSFCPLLFLIDNLYSPNAK